MSLPPLVLVSFANWVKGVPPFVSPVTYTLPEPSTAIPVLFSLTFVALPLT